MLASAPFTDMMFTGRGADVSEQEPELAWAQAVLRDYGAVLASLGDAACGIAESRLPHPRETIKAAIQRLLLELEGRDRALVDGLVEGYAMLAQFIPDGQADILRRGRRALSSGDPSHPDWADAEASTRIMTAIKLEMESLLREIRLLST